MADVRGAWNDAGEKLNELGQKLKLHYDEQRGQESQATRDELADAARRLGHAVQDGFEALGAAAKDKTVQADVKQVGQSLFDALSATFGQVSGDLRRTLAERKGAAAAEGAPPSGQATSTTEAEAVPSPEPGPQATAGGTPSAGDTEAGAGSGEQPPKVEPWGTP
jgi:hypothetical protein